MEGKMKIAIVHDSQAGNGEKLAEVMKAQLERSGNTVSVGHVEKTNPDTVAAEHPDLLIVGAAIRAFHTSGSSKEWMKALSKALESRGATIGHAAAFVTHGLPTDKANFWGRRFRKRLERVAGVDAVYPEWLSGKVDGQMGPLAEGSEDKFRAHADELRKWASENA
jgi:menaquinone-dependent protoporphyrinogen IX oxidase